MPTDFSGNVCPYCGGDRHRSFLAQERMLGLLEEFNYQECLSCGSLFQISPPTELDRFYPKSYYSFQSLSTSNALVRGMKKFRMGMFRRLGMFAPSYGSWLQILNPSHRSKIADVGCGNGQLLYELYCGGFRHLEGYDPFLEKVTEIAPGVVLYPQEIHEAQGNFDFILMHHAFEHMENPTRVLEACWAKLNPTGKLLIRLPVADAQVWKDYGNAWVQLDAPRHLTIPSVKGLSQLSRKIGFSLDQVEFDSNEFQFWGTQLYEKGEKLDPDLLPRYFSQKEIQAMQKKALQYNREGKGDQACFYFSKSVKA